MGISDISPTDLQAIMQHADVSGDGLLNFEGGHGLRVCLVCARCGFMCALHVVCVVCVVCVVFFVCFVCV
jgi:hypothetical protein